MHSDGVLQEHMVNIDRDLQVLKHRHVHNVSVETTLKTSSNVDL